jgi:hypothetical protein
MKIVRLVLLLSLVGLPAACNSATITEPTSAATISPTPQFNGTPADTTARDGSGHIIGSGN